MVNLETFTPLHALVLRIEHAKNGLEIIEEGAIVSLLSDMLYVTLGRLFPILFSLGTGFLDFLRSRTKDWRMRSVMASNL